jgi:Ca2+-binding RTX toxin-like protein
MSFHIFHINELYSNTDGTVQFIEFVGDSNGQHLWAGQTMTSTGAADYTFTTDLPSSSTLGKSVLVATQGFADLGLATPDYIIPDGFLSVSGGTLTFIGMDSIAFGALPGGTQSINGNGGLGTNSPTNFAGDSAAIPGNPIIGTAAADTLAGTADPDYIVGLASGDTLNGQGGADTLIGGSGNDKLNGGAAADVLMGGLANDTYTAGAGDLITELANQGTDLVKSAVNFVLKANVENLTLTGGAAVNGTGNGSANTMKGNGAANTLKGNGAGDTLQGLGGNDVLRGGKGDDTATGGAGADDFIFDAALNAGTNVDRITDFAPGVDQIRLDDDIFTALAMGTLAPGRLHIVPGATAANDANDRIIYDSADGHLFYDADGTGAVHSAIQFATLTGSPTITATDFLVIG